MTISLTHQFVSEKADGANQTLVQPSNWNEEHTITMATNRLLGRTTASAGAVEEITVAGDLTFAAGELSVTLPTLVSELTNDAGYITSADASVTSVAASGGTTGFTFTGGPITSSGTLTMEVSDAATVRTAIGIVEVNDTTNRLVSGGGVVWESGYTFRVSAATYYIGGTVYTSTEQTVTLTTADGSNDRIDVLYLDTTGTLGYITGTAAALPTEPDYDPTTQLKLTFVLVDAASSAPPTVTNESIYLEDTEWTSTTSGSGFTKASTNNPYAGTKCIEGTSVANNAYVNLNKGSDFTLDSYSTLAMFIRSKAAWANGRVLRVQWFNSSGVAVGTPITIATGFWGFNSSTTGSYQQVAIPIANFVVPSGTNLRSLRITDSGGSIGFYIDNIILQGQGSNLSSGGTTGITQTDADARYLQKANNLSDLTSASTARTNLGLAIGTNVQAYDAQLGDIAGITFSQGDLIYYNGSNLVRLAAGTSGYYLKTNGAGANPAWTALNQTVPIQVACSDETTALTTGTAKVTFRMPFAATLSAVRASLTTAQSSGSIFTVDINESGTTVLSTKLTIDNGEKTSTTAATAAVISDTALADDAEITIDIDQVGTGATGLKVTLLVVPT